MDPWNDSSQALPSISSTTLDDTELLNHEKTPNKRNKVFKLLLVLILCCAIALLGFVIFLCVFVPRSDRSSPQQYIHDLGTKQETNKTHNKDLNQLERVQRQSGPNCGFTCRDRTTCYPTAWVCDGLRDCNDGSDEDNCAGGPCNPSPCFNNGACLINTYGQAYCVCNGMYTGTYCQDIVTTTVKTTQVPVKATPSDPCSSNPCNNGATCMNAANLGTFFCFCHPGWSGRFCQNSPAVCSDNPCNSKSLCIGTSSWSCLCPAGLIGITCETDILECASSPCLNGGACWEGLNGYFCQCAAGFTGSRCEADIAECDSSPCQNGATCWDGPNTYFCQCSTGYAGYNCDTLIAVTPPTIETTQKAHLCADNEFYCGQEKCIRLAWICDNVIDCGDQRDEMYCNTCPTSQFNCNNGKCVTQTMICDGRNDCGNKRDELGCPEITTKAPIPTTTLPPANPCTDEQFHCGQGTCIRLNWLCDGIEDCADKGDEAFCNSCPQYLYNCNNGQCIVPGLACNGNNDCGNWRDEASCADLTTTRPPTPSPAYPCESDEFNCGQGNCIILTWICDSIFDCSDGRDEHFCNNCHQSQFNCNNGQCITQGLTCNGNADCSNGRDELGCQETTTSRRISTPAETAIRISEPAETTTVESAQTTRRTSVAVETTSKPPGTTTLTSKPAETTTLTSKLAETTILTSKPTETITPTSKPTETTTHSSEPAETTTRHTSESVKTTSRITEPLQTTTHISVQAETTTHTSESVETTLKKPNQQSKSLRLSRAVYPCFTHEFHCGQGQCIVSAWVCDHIPDCYNEQDEVFCNICSESEFNCYNGRCISSDLVCNRIDDCGNNDDELKCAESTSAPIHEETTTASKSTSIAVTTKETGDIRTSLPPTTAYPCFSNEFHCGQGQCIVSTWMCDLIPDCYNEQDEVFCNICSESDFNCYNGRCISSDLVCNRIDNCGNRRDELECAEGTSAPIHDETTTASKSTSMVVTTKETDDTTTSLPPSTAYPCFANEFHCGQGQCIVSTWMCDLIPDCYNQQDEVFCNICSESEFNCYNGRCISSNLICNRFDDCGNRRDELGCAEVTSAPIGEETTTASKSTSMVVTTTQTDEKTTPPTDGPKPVVTTAETQQGTLEPLPTDDPFCFVALDEFSCGLNQCIPSAWVCDGLPDCTSMRDELFCCPDIQFNCMNGQCLETELKCNGKYDCRNGLDELKCLGKTTMSMVITEKSTPQQPVSSTTSATTSINQVTTSPRPSSSTATTKRASTQTTIVTQPPVRPTLTDANAFPIEYCGDNLFTCFNGQCISSSWTCDTYNDCADKRDEMFCQCFSSQFNCYNGQCLSNDLVCNQRDDCGNNLDELGCPEPDPDDCESSPCENGATCVDGISSYRCICPINYSGTNCQILSQRCTRDYCQNGGVCQEFGQRATCLCQFGYTGERCESDVGDCARAPPTCTTFGVCIDGGIGQFFCICNPGFTGQFCERDIVQECLSAPCLNGGTCAEGPLGFSCSCTPGFDGLRCESELNECASSPCAFGTCYDSFNQYYCECAAGYSGVNCDTVICSVDDVLCDGICGRVCDGLPECLDGSDEQNCPDVSSPSTVITSAPDPDDCASSPCSNSGTCVDGMYSFTCICRADYTGRLCESLVRCTPDICLNGGICQELGGLARCICPYPRTGTRCESDTDDCALAPSSCKTNGICLDGVGTYFCACYPGFTGQYCQHDTVRECLSAPCLNGGSCTETPLGFTCTCTSGFTGVRCNQDLNECASMPCVHGTCYDSFNQFYCDCNPGYTGVHCESDICDPNDYVCDGVCFTTDQICDGIMDCTNGVDEQNCPDLTTPTVLTTTTKPTTAVPSSTNIPVTCEPDHFLCDINTCIIHFWVCDDIPDCDDSSDETFCQDITEPNIMTTIFTDETTDLLTVTALPIITVTCEPDYFLCDGVQCITNFWLCDLIPDCDDATDELYCQETTSEPSTSTDITSTSVGTALSTEDNDVTIITDNDVTIITVTCEPDYFLCDEFHCITKFWLCDLIPDCDDSTDEMNCQEYVTEIETEIGYTTEYPTYLADDIFQTGICGTRPSYNPGIRVLSGEDARPGAWPWVGSIRARGHAIDKHICGSTLVNSHWAVTASHCANAIMASKEPVVIFGEIHPDTPSANSIERTISRIIQHPEFSEFSYDSDIAMIKLAEPVEFNDFVRPACLATSEDEANEYGMLNCSVAGWGATRDASYIEPECVEISLQAQFICGASLPYARTYFPNTYSSNLQDAVDLFTQLLPIAAGCHSDAIQYLCSVIFPSCPQDRHHLSCKSLCTRVEDSCSRQVPFPWPDCESLPDDGQNICRVGGDKTDNVTVIRSDTLQEADIPLISTEECQDPNMYLHASQITDNMLCAGTVNGGTDTCSGDSGGPLICSNSEDMLTLVGITSWGEGCGRPGYPGVYTRVSSFVDFMINATLEDYGCIEEHEFTCSNGDCILDSLVCNGVHECSDGSDEAPGDEANCTGLPTTPSHAISTTYTTEIVTEVDTELVFTDIQDTNTTEFEPTNDDTVTDVVTTESGCTSTEFTCQISGKCIPDYWTCDQVRDCLNGEDELFCCDPHQFTCDNGRCVEPNDTCNGVNDCGDRSDEIKCDEPSCAPGEFQCSNGECIPMTWRCDDFTDCRDNSDEADCTCSMWEFMCNNSRCVSQDHVCDGMDNCGDNSDEQNCDIDIPDSTTGPIDVTEVETTTATGCALYEFQCGNGECIAELYTCDYLYDCADYSDEKANCACNTVHEFQCDGGGCINSTWVCDGEPDCFDDSDEKQCNTPDMIDLTTVSTDMTTGMDTTTSSDVCGPDEFLCVADNACIESQFVCDIFEDCSDGSDEAECSHTCSANEFLCDERSCIEGSWVCDGFEDCIDKTDEANCAQATCGANLFLCANGKCIPEHWVCDGLSDCEDSSDEDDAMCPGK